jgi:TP901 family phage tail tape measure protein
LSNRAGTLNLFITGDSSSLGSALRKGGEGFRSFRGSALKNMRDVGGGIKRFVDQRINGMAALGGGLASAKLIKDEVMFKSRLARLAIQGRLSLTEMNNLERKLFEVGKATHQMPDALLSGVEKVVEKTGNYKLAFENLETMGRFASTTGAAMEDLGGIVADLDQKFGIKNIAGALDILNVQGKDGAFTLQYMAKQGARVTSAAAAMNLEGEEGLRVMGGLLQMYMQSVGSPEQATTAFEATQRDIINNAKKIEKLGITVWDAERSKKEGKHVLRSVDALMKDIITTTKGDATKLNKIFGDEARKGVNALVNSFDQVGDFRALDKLREAGGDGAETMRDFAFWSEQTEAAWTDLLIQMKEFANTHLEMPIKLGTKGLQALNNHPLISKGLMGGAGLLGGYAMLRKFSNFLMPGGLRGKAGGLASKVPGLGGLAGLGGAQPVYVTNWPMSMSGQYSPWSGSGTKGGKAKQAVGGLLGKVLGLRKGGLARLAGLGGTGSRLAGGVLGAGGAAGVATAAAGVAAAGAAGYGIGTLINKYLLNDDTKDKIGEVGNWIASIFSDNARDAIKAREAEKEAFARADAAMQNNINIRIDKDNRVEVDGGKSKTDVSVDRGNW